MNKSGLVCHSLPKCNAKQRKECGSSVLDVDVAHDRRIQDDCGIDREPTGHAVVPLAKIRIKSTSTRMKNCSRQEEEMR